MTYPNLSSRALALILPVGLSAAALGAGQVTGIKVLKKTAGVEIGVTGVGLSRPVANLAPNGTEYNLDFTAPLRGKPMSTATGFGAVPKVGVSWISKSPAKIRVALKIKSGLRPTLTSDGNGGWRVKVGAKPVRAALPLVSRPKGTKTFAASLPPAPAPVIKARPPFLPPVEPIVQPVASLPAALAPQKNALFAAKTPKKKASPRVSLDFVKTDVVQVFRALAKQTGTNILTSEGVKGPITVSLRNVSVDEAINLLCTISGLRATNSDGTYVVTTKAQFQEASRFASGSESDALVTRVVPLYSGEGGQVKTAVLKAVGGDNSRGRFEVFLPSEDLKYAQKQDVTPEGKIKDGDSATLDVTSGAKTKDAYLVIVGSAGRLDEIMNLAASIDGQICTALGRTRPTSPAKFTKVYNVRGARAADLVTAIAGPGAAKIGAVEILATPGTSISRQAIVLNGREDEVMTVYASLEQLDSNDSAAPEFLTVNLKFSDPRAMREMLLSNVPGLAVTIPPASVGNPRLYQTDQTRRQSEERGTELPAPQGGGSPQASGMNQQQNQTGQNQQPVEVKSDPMTMSGLTQPFRDYETIAVPMRLVLRGTEEQVARGLEFVRALDVAPKHVALELRVMELNREEAIRAGIDFNLASGGAVSFLRLNNTQTDPSNSIGLKLGSTATPFDVTATLDKLANKNNLISRPNTVALDGRETELFIGDVIRYIESIQSTQNGQTVTTAELRVGVRVAVLPRVGGDGNITMDLRPAVSFLRGFDAIPGGGRLPQTSERVAQSSFNMKSGETIAISGLINDQDRRQVNGLPFLMDLPIVGQLFRRTTNERVRSELVIFVTARTIEGPLGSEIQTLPGQPEMPAHQGFPGPDAPGAKSRTKAGKKESKESGPGPAVPPFSPPAAPPKNG